MKRLGILVKLRKEGKLGLVEPSEEIERSYFAKSESYLSSAKLLLANKRLEEAVSMLYYSMYYSLLALLFRAGIKCENHAASIILLKELFGLDNSEIQFAKRERIDKQYYVGFAVAEADVVDLIKVAEDFNAKLLDYVEKLNSEKLSAARKKFSLMTATQR